MAILFSRSRTTSPQDERHSIADHVALAWELSEGASPRWGFPTPCPVCGKRGYVDAVSVRVNRMSQHCSECGARWDVAREDCAPDF